MRPALATATLPVMLLATAFSNFDRFVTGPMLHTMSQSFGTTLANTTVVATSYFLVYGLVQPFWGVVSDRIGRVQVMRIALLLAAISSFLSAVAPTVLTLAIARGLAGASFGAIAPTAITYIGDTSPVDQRQRILANMVAFMAVGSALATAFAGILTDYLTWRVLFVIVAVCCLVTLWLLRSVQDNFEKAPSHRPLTMISKVLRSRWALVVISFAFTEVGIILGFFSLLPTILEQKGLTTAQAGLLAGIYGIAVLIASRTVKFLAANPAVPLAVGGSCLVLAFLMPLLIEGVLPFVFTAVLLGAAFALFHSSLQTWITSTVPDARATAVGMMTAAGFLGGGIGATFASHFIVTNQLNLLCALILIAATVLTLCATETRRRYVAQEG